MVFFNKLFNGGIKIKKNTCELDEKIFTVNKPDVQQSVQIGIEDNDFTKIYLDEDNNIIAFETYNPRSVNNATFYYELFKNCQVVSVLYKGDIYPALITSLELKDEDALIIYYTVYRPTITVRSKDGSFENTYEI